MNQCDGCLAGIPVIDGKHRMGLGAYADWMNCQREKYIETTTTAEREEENNERLE